MAKHKFLLDPNLTASENLGLAVQYAAPVILSRYRLGNIDWPTKEEMYAEIRALTYEHFIVHKVLQHKYCRVAKSGKKLDFFDNVLSSCWSVTSNVFSKYLALFDRKHVTITMKKAEFEYKDIWDILPDTGTVLDNTAYRFKYSPTERLNAEKVNPKVFVDRLLEEYTDYKTDCILMGITPISEDLWMARNATPDEQMMYEKRSWTKEQKLEYRRERRREMREKQLAEYKRFESDPNYEGRPGRKVK